jgi:hypothetical protein
MPSVQLADVPHSLTPGQPGSCQCHYKQGHSLGGKVWNVESEVFAVEGLRAGCWEVSELDRMDTSLRCEALSRAGAGRAQRWRRPHPRGEGRRRRGRLRRDARRHRRRRRGRGSSGGPPKARLRHRLTDLEALSRQGLEEAGAFGRQPACERSWGIGATTPASVVAGAQRFLSVDAQLGEAAWLRGPTCIGSPGRPALSSFGFFITEINGMQSILFGMHCGPLL